MINNPSYDEFLKNVKNHSLEKLKDDDVYRHLTFSNNSSFNQKFHITTWPGYLAFTGDMGDFLFSRLKDMFEFFRDDLSLGRINPSYWSEKVMAGKWRRFSLDKFRSNVLFDVRGQLDLGDDEEMPKDIMDDLYYLLTASDEYECVAQIRDFQHDKISFDDFWEHDNTEYNYHYVWACYAIVWGISKYDNNRLAIKE